MVISQGSTVAATFATRAQAEAAVDALWHAGFREDEIGMAAPGRGLVEADTSTGPLERKAADGAVTGALTGGAAGTLVGALVVGLVPGIGTVLAGGLLAGIVLGAAAGAAAGCYLGPFLALEFSADEARHFHHELEVGRTIVVVKAGDHSPEVVIILRSHGGQVGLPAQEHHAVGSG
jgi:hypothetical protein